MDPDTPAPFSRTARALALAWVLAVVAVYLAVREAGLELVR